jgi:hypothetical protein
MRLRPDKPAPLRAESDPSPEEEEDEDEEEADMTRLEDPFTTRLLSFQQEGGAFTPVIAGRAVLRSLGPGEVNIALLLRFLLGGPRDFANR